MKLILGFQRRGNILSDVGIHSSSDLGGHNVCARSAIYRQKKWRQNNGNKFRKMISALVGPETLVAVKIDIFTASPEFTTRISDFQSSFGKGKWKICLRFQP
ncbi:hypothetical protein TNIN_348991 [Trichonephila inaurata madagascariensis]|uniref:Uncharacterized protein n=1 Tax=Trichonephila inaurata madagascariensis TaxID=2747483 RepID=A0A8X6YVJ2_9ARAC|nr:hypothetical protein TNIN_348991 [Trichonephila inaurata madagascariensis]